MTDFMIRSDTLENLRPGLEKARELIIDSIKSKRPILVRHHADCDGYCAAVALERAILALMYKEYRRESDLFYYYRRLPSKAPFYDYTDATKDVSNFLSDSARFEREPPLIIVADNGSSKEDLLSLKKLKLYDAKIIVIDHHPNNVENDSFIDVHVNPFLAGGGSELTAGMLGAELARLIDPKTPNPELLAATAGIADHSFGSETEQYLMLAQKTGYGRDIIKKTAQAVDFEARYLSFLESRSLVNDLLYGNAEKHKALIELLNNEIEARNREQVKNVMHYSEILDMGGFALAKIDLGKLQAKVYPSGSRTTGMLAGYAKEKQEKPVVTLGIGPDFITFRIGDELGFDVNKVIAAIRKAIPHADASGGGHPKAGTVRFNPGALAEVLEFIENHLKKG